MNGLKPTAEVKQSGRSELLNLALTSNLNSQMRCLIPKDFSGNRPNPNQRSLVFPWFLCGWLMALMRRRLCRRQGSAGDDV